MQIDINFLKNLKQSRLGSGVFWSVAGGVTAKILRFPVAITIARLMGVQRYGELASVQASIEVFTLFAGFSLGLTTGKYVAEYRHNNPIAAGNILAITSCVGLASSILFGIVLFISAPWLAQSMFSAKQLIMPLRIGALVIVVRGYDGIQMGALSGFEAFKAIARVAIIKESIAIPAVVLGTLFWGVEGALAGEFFASSSGLIVNYFALSNARKRHGIRVTLRGSRDHFPILWNFTLPAIISGSLQTPVNWIAIALLVNQTEGYKEMGIFNAANKIFTLLLLLPKLTARPLISILSERFGANDIKSSRKYLKNLILFHIAVSLPAFSGACIFSSAIMRAFGPEFVNGQIVLAICAATAVVASVTDPIRWSIAASGRMWLVLWINIVYSLLYLTGAVLIVYEGLGMSYGSRGLALSRFIAYLALIIILVPIGRLITRDEIESASKIDK